MTKKLPNRLILEEGMNKVVLKRAGAEHEIGYVIVDVIDDLYHIHPYVSGHYIRLQFKDRKFIKLI